MFSFEAMPAAAIVDGPGGGGGGGGPFAPSSPVAPSSFETISVALASRVGGSLR